MTPRQFLINQGGGLYNHLRKFNRSLLNEYFPKDEVLWTKEVCLNDALKHTSRNDWKNNSTTAYSTAQRNGWLNFCCSHMEQKRKPRGYWTKERCREDALKYSNQVEWRKNNSSACSIAQKNGWTDFCCSHMKKRKSPGYWTKSRCREDALNYTSRNDWRNNNVNAYRAAQRNKWLDELCSHMKRVQKPPGYWTKERCREDALKYNRRSEWRKSMSAYSTAQRNGWLDFCCSHM